MFAGCGGGGGDSGPAPTPRFNLGGSVSGLSGNGLVLANGTDTIVVDAGATAYTLPTTLTSGSPFSVTVQTQPTGQTCAVADGSGTMGNANVTSAAVTCITNTYTVGGSISGLIGSGLVLANGSDTLAVAADATSFTLPTAVDFGSNFSVSVQTQPTGLTCSVADGSGTVAEANVSSVVVTCNANAFNLGGSITGLTNSGLVLANGSDTLAVAAGATSFTLPTAVAFGSNFNVIVQGKAVDQTCTVGSGSGVMGAADVAGVVVSCGPASFSVSTLAGSGSAGSANGSGAVAQFRAPHGVAFDSSGNAYVADTFGNRIRRITPAGVVSTFAGSGATGSVDGVGTAAVPSMWANSRATRSARSPRTARSAPWRVRACRAARMAPARRRRSTRPTASLSTASATSTWAIVATTRSARSAPTAWSARWPARAFRAQPMAPVPRHL